MCVKISFMIHSIRKGQMLPSFGCVHFGFGVLRGLWNVLCISFYTYSQCNNNDKPYSVYSRASFHALQSCNGCVLQTLMVVCYLKMILCLAGMHRRVAVLNMYIRLTHGFSQTSSIQRLWREKAKIY